MSLDKAIRSGKERRKPFRGSQRFDSSCRHQGWCPYCRGSRLRHRKLGKVLDREAQEDVE